MALQRTGYQISLLALAFAFVIASIVSPRPSAAASATGEPTLNSSSLLPPASCDTYASAMKDDLQGLVKWLRKAGLVDSLCSSPTADGRASAITLLHAAATNGNVEMMRELLTQGANINLQTNLGITALMSAAANGRLSAVLFLLQHSANPDLQDIKGHTALYHAAYSGQQACHYALRVVKLDAENRVLLWVVLGASAFAAVGSTLKTKLAKAQAHSKKPKKKKAGPAAGAGDEPSEAPPAAAPTSPPTAAPKPAASAAQRAKVALREAVASGGLSELEAALAAAPHAVRFGGLVAEARAKCGRLLQAQQKARRAASQVASLEAQSKAWQEDKLEHEARQEAAADAARLAAAEWARKADTRPAVAGGGLSALEVELVDGPREGREGGVGAEAQLEPEREAKHVEAARLAAVDVAREAAAGAAAALAAAAVKAREEAVSAATALAEATEVARKATAKADALELAMAEGGEGGSSGAAGPSEASEAAEVPADYICPITTEIMTDPVSTLDGFTYERTAISEWLRTKNTSPTTGAKLESKTLIPNRMALCLLNAFNEAASAASKALP